MKFQEDSLHLYIQIIEVLLNKNTMENKLKIQIWSDIMCPYCYIGKRRIEGALEQFEHKAAVEIEWKSFQLMPASLRRKMMIWLNTNKI
jgi:protein disulfide-isomerase